MRIGNVGEGEAWGPGAFGGVGHVDRQEAVEVIGHPCCHRRGRGARGSLENAPPFEMLQTTEQPLSLFQMPRLDALDVGYFRSVFHDVLRITSGPPGPSPAARRAASRGAPVRCRGTAGFWQ